MSLGNQICKLHHIQHFNIAVFIACNQTPHFGMMLNPSLDICWFCILWTSLYDMSESVSNPGPPTCSSCIRGGRSRHKNPVFCKRAIVALMQVVWWATIWGNWKMKIGDWNGGDTSQHRRLPASLSIGPGFVEVACLTGSILWLVGKLGESPLFTFTAAAQILNSPGTHSRTHCRAGFKNWTGTFYTTRLYAVTSQLTMSPKIKLQHHLTSTFRSTLSMCKHIFTLSSLLDSLCRLKKGLKRKYQGLGQLPWNLGENGGWKKRRRQ